MESHKTKLQSGRMIERGIPGKPPPEPMSKNVGALRATPLHKSLISGKNKIESRKCLSSMFSSFLDIKLIFSFHSNNIL